MFSNRLSLQNNVADLQGHGDHSPPLHPEAKSSRNRKIVVKR